MIEKVHFIKNTKTTVTYMEHQEAVFVQNNVTSMMRCFGGWDGLGDLYYSFCNSFSLEVTYKEAVDFFTPNIQSLVVNK